MVLSTCNFTRSEAGIMYLPLRQPTQSSVEEEFDPIGEPPPLTPICKRQSVEPPAATLQPAAILFPIARHGIMSVAETSAVADRGVVQSRASAFKAVPAAAMAEPGLHVTLPNVPRAYPLAHTQIVQRELARSAGHRKYPNAAMRTHRMARSGDLRMKWAALRSFLRQSQGKRATRQHLAALARSHRQNFSAASEVNIQQMLQHGISPLPSQVSSSMGSHSDISTASSMATHSPPSPPCDTASLSSRASSPAALSGEESNPSSVFSHMLQPVNVDDGFDTDMAKQLQCQVREDPAVRILPSGERVFGCRRCQTTFVWRRHLEEHYFTHQTEEKASLCHICGKNFTRADHLNRHAASAHGQSTFVCQICGDSFPRASHLDRHWRTVHPKGSATKYSTNTTGVSQASTQSASLQQAEYKPIHCTIPRFLPTLQQRSMIGMRPPSPQSLLTELFSQRQNIVRNAAAFDQLIPGAAHQASMQDDSADSEVDRFEPEAPLVIDVCDEADTSSSD